MPHESSSRPCSRAAAVMRDASSRRLLGQLDREHRAEPAHVGARRRHRLEPLAEPLAELVGLRPQLLERVEDRERRGARDGVAAERAAEAAGRDRVHQLGAAR